MTVSSSVDERGSSALSSNSRPISVRPRVGNGGAAMFESPVVSPSNERVVRATRQPVPVTFRWNLGGNLVSVTGAFLDWKTELRLERDASSTAPAGSAGGGDDLFSSSGGQSAGSGAGANQGEFRCTYMLEPGTHQYKFIVDGVWRHHPDQPTVHDEVGNINNFVDVVEPMTKQLFPQRPESPPGDYGQTVPSELAPASPVNLNPETNKAMRVPNIPPHLLRALLNTAPSPDDPSTLPLPHHVMVNHLYALPRSTPASDCSVLGATHMVKNKYITTVFYRKASGDNDGGGGGGGGVGDIVMT
jgi:5'-AMP-activated protein kinase regulatory beta subunit